jgi:hypothetical protein
MHLERLSKMKIYLVGMSILSLFINLWAKMSQSTPGEDQYLCWSTLNQERPLLAMFVCPVLTYT